MKKITIILLLLPYMTAFADINSELLRAACHGHTNTLRELLKDPSINVNYQNPDSTETPLAMAAFEGHAECVRALLAHEDIDPNLEQDTGTPLSLAVRFYTTKRSCYMECIKLLLAHPKIDPDAAPDDGMTPLMLSAFWNNIKILEMLVPITKNINALDYEGKSALYHAVSNNSINAIKMLIAHGAHPHAGSPSAYTLTSNPKYAHLREVIETSQQAALKAVLGTNPVQLVRRHETGNRYRPRLSHKNPTEAETASASKPVHDMPAAASSAEPASDAMAPRPYNRPRA